MSVELKEQAEQALSELEQWHDQDERFRRRLTIIRTYIEKLEAVGIASVQPGPDFFPKDDDSAIRPSERPLDRAAPEDISHQDFVNPTSGETPAPRGKRKA